MKKKNSNTKKDLKKINNLQMCCKKKFQFMKNILMEIENLDLCEGSSQM